MTHPGWGDTCPECGRPRPAPSFDRSVRSRLDGDYRQQLKHASDIGTPLTWMQQQEIIAELYRLQGILDAVGEQLYNEAMSSEPAWTVKAITKLVEHELP